MKCQMIIHNRVIALGLPAYVIAELSANHNGSYEQAVALVQAAKNAGADAVKLQTYTADTLTIQSSREYFRIGGGTLWDGRTLHELYQEAHMPWEWQPRLKQVADDLGITLFSSPFDSSAVDFLEAMDVPAYKIASPEIVDLPFIERVAQTGKPLIISTGMATLAEIDEALQMARAAGATQISLLHCISAYPAPPEEMNLRTIPHLAQAFGVPVGLSDHTRGIAAPVAAVALGACLIEKHLTLSRSVSSPDSKFSLEPHEFKDMVSAVRAAEQALGKISYEPGKHEESSRVFRRSLFVVADMQAGEAFTEDNVRSIRPAHGLSPKYLHQVIGRHAAKHIEKGTPLHWDFLT
jgi:pseudaminic acid synthase